MEATTQAPDALAITSDDELRKACEQLERRRSHIRAKTTIRDEAMSAAATAFDRSTKRQRADAEQLEADIEAYARAHRERLYPGKAKTADVGPLKLSFRKASLKAKLTAAVDVVVKALRAADLGVCVRVPDPVVDLPTVKKLREQVEGTIPGIEFEQGDDTFSC